MAGLDCTGLRMKHLPHALFEHNVDENEKVNLFVILSKNILVIH